MQPDPHQNNSSGITALRDHLAGDRTVLANERTFLSYVRTSLTFFVAGISMIRFFDHTAFVVIGWIFIPIAVMILGTGIRSFKKNRGHIIRLVCNLTDRRPT